MDFDALAAFWLEKNEQNKHYEVDQDHDTDSSVKPYTNLVATV